MHKYKQSWNSAQREILHCLLTNSFGFLWIGDLVFPRGPNVLTQLWKVLIHDSHIYNEIRCAFKSHLHSTPSFRWSECKVGFYLVKHDLKFTDNKEWGSSTNTILLTDNLYQINSNLNQITNIGKRFNKECCYCKLIYFANIQFFFHNTVGFWFAYQAYSVTIS